MYYQILIKRKDIVIDNVLIKIYHHNKERGVFLGYILVSTNINLPHNSLIYVLVYINKKKILITEKMRTLSYDILEMNQIEIKTIQYILNLLEYDFSIYIKGYLGNLGNRF